jgi:hypothetical protein
MLPSWRIQCNHKMWVQTMRHNTRYQQLGEIYTAGGVVGMFIVIAEVVIVMMLIVWAGRACYVGAGC